MVVSNPAKSAVIDFLSVRSASQIDDNMHLGSSQCRSDGRKICGILSDIYVMNGFLAYFTLCILMPALNI